MRLVPLVETQVQDEEEITPTVLLRVVRTMAGEIDEQAEAWDQRIAAVEAAIAQAVEDIKASNEARSEHDHDELKRVRRLVTTASSGLAVLLIGAILTIWLNAPVG